MLFEHLELVERGAKVQLGHDGRAARVFQVLHSVQQRVLVIRRQIVDVTGIYVDPHSGDDTDMVLFRHYNER